MPIIPVNTPFGLAAADTTYRYLMPNHLQILHNKLLDVYSGKCRRLLVNMPPRHGKSEMISKYFPAWYLMNRPDDRVLLCSFAADIAASFGRKVRNLIREFGEPFGVRLASDSNAADRFDIQGRNGGLKTAGTGGDITGRGANIFIIDDPVKNDQEAKSKTYREHAYEWFRATAYTRLEPNASIIMLMTRWHYDDLAGRILRDNIDDWDAIKMPAFTYDYNKLDEKGEPEKYALWPERFDKADLERIEANLGTQWFSSLYQQTPQASDSEILKPDWWKYYDPNTLRLPPDALIVQSWDTAFKATEKNDYSVCTTGALVDNKYYILDVWRNRVLFPELEKTVKGLYDKFKPNIVLIEDAASGQSLIQVLSRETKIPLKGIQPTRDKVTRAHTVTPLLESGQVYLPENAHWLTDFINECAEFPFAAHDDTVDSLTQLLTYLRTRAVAGRNPSFLTGLSGKHTNVFSNY